MFFDLHNDFATALSDRKRDGYLKAVSKSGIVTAAIFTSELKTAAKKTVERLTAELALHTPVAIEDLGFCADCYSDFDFSPYFYCSLTWNGNNAFAGGALDDGSLTKAGRAVINSLNGCCALDLAHINKKSFFDALDEAKRPMCSHTGFNDHPRSLDGEQISAIKARRGIIGISGVASFTGAKTCKEFAAAIDRFVCKYGIELLALGTDFNGTKDLPVDFQSYDDIKNLVCELRSLGYDDSSINKILFENALRFYEEIKGEGHLRKPVDNEIRRQEDGGDLLRRS